MAAKPICSSSRAAFLYMTPEAKNVKNLHIFLHIIIYMCILYKYINILFYTLLDSKSCIRKDVSVRVRPRAPTSRIMDWNTKLQGL